MDLFDDSIIEIRDWVNLKKKAGPFCSYSFSSEELKNLVLKDPAGSGRGGDIVLKEETRMELGHPSMGSCAAVLVTHRMDLVSDGTISLIGPEITEMEEGRHPFAQIILAALNRPDKIDLPSQTTMEIENISSRIDRVAHQSAQTDGYMIRSVPSLIWARVSKKAFHSGFSLNGLGGRILAAIKHGCPQVRACSIFFVTRSKTEVDELDDLVEKARVKQRQLETYAVGSDGEFECSRELDCNSCSEQVVCDTIRDVIRIRKGDRVVSIGGGESTRSRSE